MTRESRMELAENESSGAKQGQRSTIVADGGIASKISDGLQHRIAQGTGRRGCRRAQHLFHIFQTKSAGGVASAFTLDHAARYQQQRSLFGQCYRWSLGRGMREESEREAG